MTVRTQSPRLAPSETQSVLVERRQTQWQTVEILRHPYYGHQLVIDGDLQISEADFAYESAMVAPLLTLPECRQVAILGGGDGGVLNGLLQACDRLQKPISSVTLIDIDKEIIELCRRWMPLLCGRAFDDPRANIIVGDAFAWIAKARDLDAVIYDLTMDPVRQGTSRQAFMEDILIKIERSLKPGGVLSLQACGEWTTDREQLLAELRTNLQEHFEYLQEQTVVVPSYVEMWTFMAACKPG